MIRNGKYAQYNGKEYELLEDMDDNFIIVTENKNLIDDTFEDTYHTGVYSKIVDLSDLDEIYKITTYGEVNEERILIIKEKKEEYLVSTNDCKIGEKLKLERVDKYGYEGWLSSNLVRIIEDKQVIK